MINFKAGRRVVLARRKRKAEFEALPLIEQIRIVVREEISRAALARDLKQGEEMLFHRPHKP